MRSPFGKVVCLIGIAALCIAGFFAWRHFKKRPAKVQLLPRSEQSVQRTAFALEPIFLQKDPKWAEEKTGGAGEPLRSVGCTICSLSMALAKHGITLDPSALNQKLKDNDGFTAESWVKWDALRKISNGRVRVDIPDNPTNRDIESALAVGNPVLVKIFLSPGVYHWVLLVGREGHEYLMKDPLGDGKALQSLSSLGSDIYAVRIVRKVSQ